MSQQSTHSYVWQVRLPDGSFWVPLDSRPGPRASWIYARSTAEAFARQLGGEVVEVTRRQQEKLLDEEIAEALQPELTETQQHHLDELRSCPLNRVYQYNRQFYSTSDLSGPPIRGLNAGVLKKLVVQGLVTKRDAQEGPRRYVIYEATP